AAGSRLESGAEDAGQLPSRPDEVIAEVRPHLLARLEHGEHVDEAEEIDAEGGVLHGPFHDAALPEVLVEDAGHFTLHLLPDRGTEAEDFAVGDEGRVGGGVHGGASRIGHYTSYTKLHAPMSGGIAIPGRRRARLTPSAYRQIAYRVNEVVGGKCFPK